MLNKQKQAAASIGTIDAGHETPLRYQIRRSERAKKTRIVVTADKVEVVAPVKASERHIAAFVNAKQTWIRTAIIRVHQRTQSISRLAPEHYVDGVTIPYQGKQVSLQIKPSSARNIRLSLQADQQFVVYIPTAHQENSSHGIRQALESWMKQQIRHQATQLIAKHATKHQLFPRQLRIKTQKTRWGSCGPKNDINLNWLLMLAPPVILEYVVVHELCHIKHKNHSEDFWRLVAEHMPNYLQHRHWLKQHGASIMQGL